MAGWLENGWSEGKKPKPLKKGKMPPKMTTLPAVTAATRRIESGLKISALARENHPVVSLNEEASPALKNSAAAAMRNSKYNAAFNCQCSGTGPRTGR